MRRLLGLGVVLCFFVCAPTASAQFQRAFGFCSTGGQNVVVQGLTQSSPPQVQSVYPSCSITVFNQGTIVLATIFSDAAGATPLPNPFTAGSSNGYWFFYAANGRYDVTQSGAGIVTPFTLGDITLGAGGAGGGGLPPGVTANWANIAACVDNTGQGGLILEYDPLNTLGQGTFPCFANSAPSAVVLQPSSIHQNSVVPATATDPILTGIYSVPPTVNVMDFLLPSGHQFFLAPYTDGSSVQRLELWVGRVKTLDPNAVNQQGCGTVPAGQANAGTILWGCKSANKLLFSLDDIGTETDYIGAATPKTLTQTTFDFLGAGNVPKFGSTTITGLQGTDTKVLSAGTVSGAAGTGLCIDGNGGATTSACAGTSAAQRCAADFHCTIIEANGASTSIAGVGDAANATGTVTANAPDANFGANNSIATTGTINTTVGYSGNFNYRTGRNIDFIFSGGINDGSGGITNMRAFFCATDQPIANQFASAAPTGNYACVRYDTGAGDTHFQLITDDGTASQTLADTGVTPDTIHHKYEIIFNDGTPNVVLQIDGVTKATNTTHLPAASINLKYVVGQQNLSATNETFRLETVWVKSDK